MEFIILSYVCGCEFRVWQDGQVGIKRLCQSHNDQIKDNLKPLSEIEQRIVKGVF